MKKLFLALSLMLLPIAASAACKVTKEGYDSLSTGISYEKAVRLLGCEGEELSRSDMVGFSTIMFGWYGSRWTGANMNAMFQNGKLVSKAQFGLK